MAEESSAEPMKQAKGLLDAYQAGGQLQLLVDAATILMTTPQVMLVDPERSRLTYDVADAILGVASRDRRRAGDFLDGGLRMVEAELDGIVGSFGPPLDFYSAGLLLTMRAALLSERYYLEHRVEDLAAALGDVQSATDYLTIPRLFDDPDAAWLWQTVASILSRQADFTHRIDHLEAVVQALEQARAAQGASDNVRAQIRWKLAIARVEYWTRVVATDAAAVPRLDEAADEAITEITDLIDNAGEKIDRRAWYQNLAVLHLERSGRPGQSPGQIAADLTAALRAVDGGLALLPAGDADRVPLLETRSAIFLARSPRGTSVEASEAMRTAFEAAAEHRAPEVGRAGHRWAWACASAGRWPEAAAVGRHTLEILQALVRVQPHQDYRWAIMREVAGRASLAGLTAFACVAAGHPPDGALVLEHGQAIVLGDRYAQPRAVHNALLAQGLTDEAAEYLRAVAAVRELNASDESLHRAENELVNLAAGLRGVPVVGALLSPVDEASLLAAAAGTTVVYLASSEFGGVALVMDGTGLARAVELPEVTDEQVWAVAERFSRRVVAPLNPPGLRSKTIEQTCDWLGRAVMTPLRDAVPGTSRVTLVPTGQLVGLPFHAARIGQGHDTAPALIERCYTYSPSAITLRPAVPRLSSSLDVLAVADPTRRGTARLPGALREARAVERAYPNTLALRRRQAAHDVVFDAFSRVGLAHLACHGVGDPVDPMESRLLLADRDLRLSELLAVTTDQLRLVVLSACQTAAAHEDLPGESLSLAAGIVATSADAVIGSLWPVPDRATSVLMTHFYRRLEAGVAPPDALREAQLTLANGATTRGSAATKDWTHPYYWAGFVFLAGVSGARA